VEAEALLGVVDDFADFLDADGGSVELLEVGFGVVGNQRGEGGFAGAGGAVEDDAGKPVGLEHAAEKLAGTEEVLLAGEFVEGAGAHAGGEGSGLVEVLLAVAGEEIHRGIIGVKCETERHEGTQARRHEGEDLKLET
jgi:hypothetical protein